MSENPYQSPAGAADAYQPDGIVRVEGDLVVVRKRATFPPFCVISGLEIPNSPMQTQTLKISQFGDTHPRSCFITYGMSPATRVHYDRYTFLRRVGAAAILLSIAIDISLSTFVWMPIAILLSAFLSFLLPSSPLKIRRHHSGEFWIEGCGSEFLQRAQETLET